MQRFGIGLRIDGDGLQSHIVAGADDPDGDFAAIGNQNFFHVIRRSENLRSKFDRMRIVNADFSDHVRSSRFDLVHHFHRFDDADHGIFVDRSPTLTKGRIFGRGEA